MKIDDRSLKFGDIFWKANSIPANEEDGIYRIEQNNDNTTHFFIYMVLDHIQPQSFFQ